MEADTCHDAACKALKIHRDHTSIATVFNVEEIGTTVYEVIDLLSEQENES